MEHILSPFVYRVHAIRDAQMFFPNEPVVDSLIRGGVLALISMLWVVSLIRMNGLRSLSKMTNFDFIMTIAMGSLVAGAAQASKWTEIAQVGAAMATLFAFQNIASRLRKSSSSAEKAMQNQPILLMRDGEFCEPALKSTRVAKSDVVAKFREANALDISKVKAVVLETTGDVSVLHGDYELDLRLIENISDKTS